MFEKFQHRSLELERLDTGDYTAAEYRRWQKEMWYIHRFFGEARALRKTLFAEIKRLDLAEVSILDVGAGSGELLRIIASENGLPRCVLTGVELNEEAVETIKTNGLTAVRADGRNLPFPDESYDFAICSLVLHHLNDADAIELLAEMARVSRRGIFVLDLNREPLPYYAYKVFGGLLLQRFTVEDGALSILRSRRPQELLKLAADAGLHDAQVVRSRLNRLILTA